MVPAEVVLSGLLWMIFGLLGVVTLRRVYFWPTLKLVVPLKLAVLPFSVEVCYVFVAGVWEVELLVAVVLEGCIGPVKEMRLMCIVLGTLLTLLFLLLYSLKSVADVLEGIEDKGFTSSRWNALLGYWEAVCRYGPCGPISSLDPRDRWIPRDFHGFHKLVCDSLELLNDFLQQVVVSRDLGMRKWTRWLREDLSSGTYVLLRPDFVPPSPFLVVKILTLSLLVFWLNLILLMLSFVKVGCVFSCRSGHPVVTPDQFLDFVGHLLPQEPSLCLPRITGRDLQSTAGGLDGLGMRLRRCRVETSGVWPQGLLDAYIAMIPKADGDSTPLGQRPLSVLPVV